MSIISIKNCNIIFGDKPIPTGVDILNTTKEELLKYGIISGVLDANLDINTGEILVLMGLSGSGKTSLLRAINGLNVITSGSCIIECANKKTELYKISPKDLRDLRLTTISMVFQQYGLLPWRSVHDNVGFGLEIAGVEEKSRHARIDEILELVGLKSFADKKISELSGGMQQRVGIARALVTQSPILLMDEPFSALDPIIRYNLQTELLEMQQKFNRTIVFVSHDLDEAVRIGHRIAIMHHGKIVQVGKPIDIILNPKNEYVAEFVRHINPLNVLNARALLMVMPTKYADDGKNKKIQANITLKEILRVWQENQENLSVYENDKFLGVLSGKEIMAAITGIGVN